ncbi:phosphoribosylformylglycinamidine cyclo-ligase [bacterium]
MPENKNFTYKDAGVDIDAGDKFVEKIKEATKGMNTKNLLGGLGGFGGAYELSGYKNPVLISGTDGVGTKLKLAFISGKHDTVGIDLVAMCVNDIITCGALPLFFLDYFAIGKLSLKIGEQVIKGIVEGCRQSECMLLGGETAEMPDFYKKGEYDLAGFAVGVVEKDEIIDGSKIQEGDVLIGLPSTGAHSNGFSLVRKVLSLEEIKKYENLLLAPTKIYVKDIKPALKNKLIKGLVHITGGGMPGNIPRVIPKEFDCVIKKESFEIPEIFEIIQKKGNIKEQEMFKVFNMGIGLIIIASPIHQEKICNTIPNSKIIGSVIKGNGKVNII